MFIHTNDRSSRPPRLRSSFAILALFALTVFLAMGAITYLRDSSRTPLLPTLLPRAILPNSASSSSPYAAAERRWTLFRDEEAGIAFSYPSDWSVSDVPGCDEMNGCAFAYGPEGRLSIDRKKIDPGESLPSGFAPIDLHIGGYRTWRSLPDEPYRMSEPQSDRYRMITLTVYLVVVPAPDQDHVYIYFFNTEADGSATNARSIFDDILGTVVFSGP